jgi:Patatin-like phospholipase
MPADYVSELAVRMFRKIEGGEGKEFVKSASQAVDAGALENELNLRPDLQAHAASITGYTPSKWLLQQELTAIDVRRKKLDIERAERGADPYQHAAKSGLMGLCFSGGGIRSATFNLGVLQGLAELKLLRCFDYLSTVSGGGYIHQWFAAWSKRHGFEEVEKQLIPPPDTDNPGTHPEPIRWLRRYSNYLTPQTGILSGDTWVAFAIWLRNTLLNQIILASGLLFLMLVPHLLEKLTFSARNVTLMAAIIVVLHLIAIYFVGKELLTFTPTSAGGQPPKALGQGGVYAAIVLPLVVSAVLLTLLIPYLSAPTLGVDLLLLLFGMALTITFAGGAPLAYLKTHANTSKFNTVSEFWNVPKCWAHVKFVFVVIGQILVCALATFAGAAWVIAGLYRLPQYLPSITTAAKLPGTSPLLWQIFLIVAPPLVLGGPLVMMLFVVGFLGRTFRNSHREWLSRIAAWMGLFMLIWILALVFSFLGRKIVLWIAQTVWVRLPLLATWVAGSLGGLLAGKSASSSGGSDDKAPPQTLSELIAVVGPYIFIVGLLLLLAALGDTILMRLPGPLALAGIYGGLFVICVLFAWRVDINEFSLHAFYRNRLTRCYLGASRVPRRPNPFTGFDDNDADVAVCDLTPENNYNGPFPIFCTTLNLTFGQDLAWQERKGASFVFTPLYSGYDVAWTAAKGETNLRFNGFVKTPHYAYPETGVHLNTAVAISGAALSPNMGYHTNAATAFLMTVFSVRLGWWLRNPRTLDEDGTRLGRPADYPRPSPSFSLLALAKELLGRTDDTSSYVYLSDGGHFDNMGLYELVRRRCRYIVICDSEDDGDLKFSGIGMAIRKCRIDFGVEISLDLRLLQRPKDSAYSSAHCVAGTVRYPEDPDNPGTVVYLKSTLTGDEPADVLNYKSEHACFPHDSTTNQWFTESQFESYRRLGHHVAFSVFEPAMPDPVVDCGDQRRNSPAVCHTIEGREGFFDNLLCTWWAPTAEMERFAAQHTDRYQALLVKARTDDKLAGFFSAMQTGDSIWKKGRSSEEIEYATQFSSELIEFIWMVYNQLNLVLPEKRDHPYSRGWSRIFTNWAKLDVVREAWRRYRHTYSSGFQRYAESACVQLHVPD